MNARRISLVILLIVLCIGQAVQGQSLDLNTRCIALGYVRATNIDSTAYGWRCVDRAGNQIEMSVQDACDQLFGRGTTQAVYGDFQDESSWTCRTRATQQITAIPTQQPAPTEIKNPSMTQTPTPTTTECPAFAVGFVLNADGELVPGQTGRVVPGLGPNVVRDTPTTRGARVGAIPENGFFDVLDGPTCAVGYWWWRVSYTTSDGTVTGWTADGDAEHLWLERVPDSETTPEPNPVPTVTPNRTDTGKNAG